MTQNQSILEGTYDKTVYANEENGWTVGRFIPLGGKNSPVTIVGHLNAIVPGEQIKLTGKWDSHPKYGAQFVVDQCESVLPATLSGIEKYLSSGLIAGIGPVMAQRLVAKFGQRTIEVIDSEPKRLREVEGIGEKRVEMIREAWEEQKATRGIILSLQSHKISTSLAIRIYRHYGEESLKVLKEDPYRLAMDVHGIGFKTADDIAKQLGMPPDSPQRAKAGLLYVLQEASQQGHVYYPKSLLLERAITLLSVDELIVSEALEGLLSERKHLVAEASIDPDLPVYLPSLYRAEGELTARIAALAESGGSRFLDKSAVERFLSTYERFRQISFASKQRRAISTALTQSFSVITGGPGTGKTTLVSAIVQIARKGGLRVALAAPTGRAAKRLTEATRLEAKTIHRLLEYQPANGGFRFKSRDLPCDLLVVDEVSMLDTPLAYHLLEAVPSKAQVVFVGDVDQLPSVGPGNVLRDLIESDLIPVVKLDEVYRQGRESSIVFNA
ncbi:MAG: AAA family ATPase, partial [Deltaproteobacteria bacterium]|nr:AAA family ATPase [Deltaproteobacteria bacterium]